MKANAKKQLVLASVSPRRYELLKLLQLEFKVMGSTVDEKVFNGLSPAELVTKLSYAKAKDVADSIKSNYSNDETTYVLGADTIVVLDNDILCKPESETDAINMLTKLSGKMHNVYTGVSIIQLPDLTIKSGCEISQVYFKPLQLSEIKSYIATGEPMDKAGAYAIQGAAGAFIEKIEGCFSNIIGLPLPLVVKLLREFGFMVLGISS